MGFVSCRRNSPLEPGHALEIIDQIGHADLDGGTSDANGAHDQDHAMLLSGEHMLDMSANLGPTGIGPRDPLWQSPPGQAFLVDVADEHALGQEGLALLRAISRICPYARGGVVLADQIGQPGAVMSIGGAGDLCTDQAMSLVTARLLPRLMRLDASDDIRVADVGFQEIVPPLR